MRKAPLNGILKGPKDILKQNTGLLGDRKYLIDSQWWQQWCDYVNFNPNALFEIKDIKLDALKMPLEESAAELDEKMITLSESRENFFN